MVSETAGISYTPEVVFAGPENYIWNIVVFSQRKEYLQKAIKNTLFPYFMK